MLNKVEKNVDRLDGEKWHQISGIYQKTKTIKTKWTFQNLKSIITEIKNSLDKFNNRLNTVEHKINELEDESKEHVETKAQREKKDGEKKR